MRCGYNVIQIFCMLSLIFLIFPFGMFAQSSNTWNVEAQILVKRDTRQQILYWVEAQGGYFTLDSSSRMELRIPNEKLNEFYQTLEDVSSSIYRYDQFSRDLSQELANVRAAITSRSEILEKNLTLLDNSGVTGTLAVEREIRSLITELEQYRGQLRVMQNQLHYARVSVFLDAPTPGPANSSSSNFSWLNELSFFDFMQEEWQ